MGSSRSKQAERKKEETKSNKNKIKEIESAHNQTRTIKEIKKRKIKKNKKERRKKKIWGGRGKKERKEGRRKEREKKTTLRGKKRGKEGKKEFNGRFNGCVRGRKDRVRAAVGCYTADSGSCDMFDGPKQAGAVQFEWADRHIWPWCRHCSEGRERASARDRPTDRQTGRGEGGAVSEIFQLGGRRGLCGEKVVLVTCTDTWLCGCTKYPSRVWEWCGTVPRWDDSGWGRMMEVGG